ncbi:MAG: UDP-N-acetylglucosamine--N-acetylmuramyl-(pentapeptide) pyrophosphoryl-undecaprenol N-acetylglucosamine transferase [Candidatus Omnitrophota bacterium]
MRILAVAGASGGHIFPAVGFLDDFKAVYPDARTLLILPARAIDKGFDTGGHPVRAISVANVSMKASLRNIRACFNFIRSFFESIVILARFKPDIVVGFGSISSIPVLTCAWLLRTTVMIHEQNVLPGRANRFLAFISDRIAVSFQESAEYFSAHRANVVWTGNPVRKSLVAVDKISALGHFGLSAGKFTILVMGGSQASRNINYGFARAFLALRSGGSLQVIHLCGTADQEGLQKEYSSCWDSVRLVAFLKNMEYAYSAADLVISRAGATTIAELMKYRLPAVLIPYPHAYAHQDQNARVLALAGCANIVTDAELAGGALNNILQAVAREGSALEGMRRSFERFSSGTPLSLVDEAVKIHSHD